MNQPIRILFVCHGNICRSPLAEFVMKDIVRQAGLENQFVIASAATRTDEIGSDVYPPTRQCMDRYGVPYEKRAARQLRQSDMGAWDYIIGMDDENVRDMRRMLGREAHSKIHKLMEFARAESAVGGNARGEAEIGGDGVGSGSAGSDDAGGVGGGTVGGVGGVGVGGGSGGVGVAACNYGGGRTAPDVADPWYTRDFERTYDDVLAGCQGLLAHTV